MLLVEFVGSLDAPIAPAALRMAMKQRHGWKPAATNLTLQQALDAGRLFRDWPRKAVWHRSAAAQSAEALLAAARRQALPESKLARAAGLKGGKAMKALVATLLSQQALRLAGKLLYAPDAPHGLIAATLEPKLGELAAFGISREQIAAYFGATSGATPKPAESTLAQRILDAVTRLQPGPSVPVTVHEIRAVLGDAAKEAFDLAVMDLARRQKIRLVRHDHGSGLPEDQRRQLVQDGNSYYGAMTVREAV